MKTRILLRTILPVLFLLSIYPLAIGQNLSAYLTVRVNETAKARIDQTDPTRQAAPPAATGNSTSLVERSSAPDILGLGLDFLNLSDATGSKKSVGPKTITFSAYALKTKLSGQDPLDPEVYNKYHNWRRVSFTVGFDTPENTTEKDPVAGIKLLLINGRDLSSHNQTEIQAVQTALDPAGVAFSNIQAEVRQFFENLRTSGRLPSTIASGDDLLITLASKAEFPKLLSSLTDDEKKAIDGIISKRISDFVNLKSVTRDAVRSIRQKPQFAISFITTQRKGGRPDEYSGTFSFDKGMADNGITINGSFMATKTPAGKNTRGGQFAAALHMPLNGFKPLGYRDPLLLSIEANGTGMTGATPMFKAQAKVTIPLLPGMDLPISISVANRSEFIKEKEVKGKFGFTFDLGKVLTAFRDGAH